MILFGYQKLARMINVEKKIGQLVSLIKKTLHPGKIILFGSRAKGTAVRGSDIDIAVEGVPRLSVREERYLKEKIDEVSGLLSVDILFLDYMGDEAIKKVVKETGVVLYEKK